MRCGVSFHLSPLTSPPFYIHPAILSTPSLSLPTHLHNLTIIFLQQKYAFHVYILYVSKAAKPQASLPMVHIVPLFLQNWNCISYRNFTFKRILHFPHDLYGVLIIYGHFLNQCFQPVHTEGL